MVKRIMSRFIVGVLLMLAWLLIDHYFNTGLILTNVNAKSCGYSGTTNQTVVSAIERSYGQTYTTSDGLQTLMYTFQSTDNKTINIGDHDYVDLYVPLSLVFSYQPSNSGAEQTQQTLNVMGLLCTTSNGCFNAQITQGGMTFRIDRNITLSNVRIRASTFYGNWSAQGSRAWFGNIWSLNFYDCSDDDALLEEQQRTNDILEDDSIDDNNTSSSISSMNNHNASNNSITQLLTLPITLYQSILNSTSGSCSTINLGSLYNHSLSLPCINLQNVLGSTLYGIIDILISGLFILSFRKKMVDIFNHMTSLNDRGNELE